MHQEILPIKTLENLQLQSVIDGLEDELIVIDKDFHIVQANRAFYNRHQIESNEVIGKYCYDVSHGLPELCKPPRHECPINNVWETGKPARATHMHMYEVGGKEQRHYLDIIAAPIYDNNGNITHIVELLRDVSEAKHLELEINEAHQNLLALNKIANVVSQSLDLETVLSTALDKSLEMLKADTGGIMLWDENTQQYRYHVHRGLSPQYITEMTCRAGEGITGIVAKTGKSILLKDISRDKRAAHPGLIKLEGLKSFVSVPLAVKDKILGVLNISSRGAREFTSQDIGLLSNIGSQVAIAIENARLHQEVQQQDRIRGELLNQLYSIQEEERKRIARELHDETTQSLAALAANLEAILLNPALVDKELKVKLKSLQNLAVSTIDGAHKLIYELRPTMLDDLGLVSAVRAYAKQEFKKTNIALNLKIFGKEKRLSPQLENTLYRVIQEAINNITRHSHAHQCNITIKYKLKTIRVNIEDNGQGFNVRETFDLRDGLKGLGILGMKERIELVNGNLDISSRLNGEGTVINIEIPIINGGENGQDQNSRRR